MVVLSNQGSEAFAKAVEEHLEPMTHIRTDGYSTNMMLHGRVGKLNMQKIGDNYEEGSLENVDWVISLAMLQYPNTLPVVDS